MSIRSTIIDTIVQIADQRHKHLAPLTDDLRLLESGLDLICIATLVLRLEDTLGVDPLSDDDEIDLPVTVGDLISIYEKVL